MCDTSTGEVDYKLFYVWVTTISTSICILSAWLATNLFFFLKEFDDYRDADDAVYELNGKELCGERYYTLPHDFLFTIVHFIIHVVFKKVFR